ncbi:MAG: LysR substrate-binding domain-containing protein, partial [Paracoccaceae bacterium]|nr:LysR substrate-binding domain-containing protein [Paracoccaceae bacterium]
VASGTITIAFAGAMTYDSLPRIMVRARADLPEIRLELIQMESAAQHEAIRIGHIDIGLSRPLAPTPLIDHLLVAREPMMLAIPQQHPVAMRRRPTLDLIEGEPFIAFSPAARYMHDKLDALFAAQGIQPDVVQRLTHSQAILSLVSVGFGLAIVPQEARNACFDNVVFRPLERWLDCHADTHANWSVENMNPALREFRAMLKSEQMRVRGGNGV